MLLASAYILFGSLLLACRYSSMDCKALVHGVLLGTAE